MRRPALTVDTDVHSGHSYELTQIPSLRHSVSLKSSFDSPSSSLRTIKATVDDVDVKVFSATSATIVAPDSPASPQIANAYSPPVPSIRLLFSLVSRRDALTLLLPAIVTSVIAGGVAPFMTHVIGQVFDAFAEFPLSGATAQDRRALRNTIGIDALELIALAVGAIALGSVTSALWISIGERNVMRLRSRVYGAVSGREMEWFDTKMGAEDAVINTDGEGPVGAGGLMAKFNRDTDDVRMASSLASGMLVQYTTTCIACLVLAFMRSWALTLVILSAVPALMFIQVFSQGAAGPLVNAERKQTAVAATLVERAINAIATVKAFNAQAAEQASLDAILDKLHSTTTKTNGVWGLTSAFSQFVSMGMFVQGFWFGAKLVRDGTVSAGDVMSVFWACLIAASNIQMCIPQFITLAKGKFAMVSLVTLINPPPRPSPSAETLRTSAFSTNSYLTLKPVTPMSMLSKRAVPQTLRKIRPVRCTGEFSLNNVTFAYPSRPTLPVLQDVSVFFPANETTFVVGGSGSGKSTIAQLLAHLYVPAAGSLYLGDQDAAYIDERWLRTHVAVVSQSCILFEGSVHDNVAMGVAGLRQRPEDVTRKEVVAACTAALMHEFVRDLPDGYETKLGTGGASLSGGQKQRLAIARAMLRDPTILVLDEATSALDATSRVLVFEAIKAWRTNKTTIVITHDLSQITAGDFAYVLKDGRVVEQGYRTDLEAVTPEGVEGEFRRMMRAQGAAGGFPAKRESQLVEAAPGDVDIDDYVERVLEQAEADKQMEADKENRRLTIVGVSAQGTAHQSVGLSGWMFDVVQDLTRSRSMKRPAQKHKVEHLSLAPSVRLEKRQSYDVLKKSCRASDARRLSLQLTPTSPSASFPIPPTAPFAREAPVEDDAEFELEKIAVERSGATASKRRMRRAIAHRTKWTDINLDGVVVEAPSEDADSQHQGAKESTSLIRLARDVYPTIPNKPVVAFGVVICLLSGAMTPIFSYILARLLFEVSSGATNVHAINLFGGIVLAVAATDGLLMGLKFFVMETGAMTWVTKLRKECYARLLAQDKKFFDRTDNSAVCIVQTLVKDGDDARNLIAVVLGQCVAVSTMLGVGLIWALVSGWQLTLAGLAIGPVFAATMSIQANFVARAERRNKLAREEIAKGYYECISNIRAIRCMSFENVFQKQFEDSVSRAYITGVKGAFIEGCSFGVANGLIYLAEALLFFVGAVLVANGTYTYLRMVEVLNLVVFTVTIASQLMAFTQKIAKATNATRDLNKILALRTDTDEARGSAMPPVEGDIKFTSVEFSYPERSDVPVLQKISLNLRRNECVAVVGASGCGKSTVAALLQRLYEPSSGLVTIGDNDLFAMDVKHLRKHISVVSQNPNLFDATIAENIAYGSPTLSAEEVQRAAQAAHVHDFIMSLPEGYDTPVGENAALISGGQAQRLAIARALARPTRVLVLDECTSALDPASQAAVMDTIRAAKVGRTTLVVTHKLPVMQMCDRIVVLAAGAVAEEGSYEELVHRNGVFAQLARGGEWSGE